MKRSKFSEEQVACALRHVEAGTPVSDLCRQLGASGPTFRVWTKKEAHLGVSELRELRQLREENAKPKRLMNDLRLEKHVIGDVIQKNSVKPARRRALVEWVRGCFRINVRRTCRLAQCSRTAWYMANVTKEQSALRMPIRAIAQVRPRFGFRRIHVMRRREGWLVNRNRVHGLYRLEGLQLRMWIRRRKHMGLHRGQPPKPTAVGQRRSMDFVHAQLSKGRPFRVLTVVDQWRRESPLLQPVFSFSSQAFAELLERRVQCESLPLSVTVDHGTEFTPRALEDWAYQCGMKIDFTHPGRPTESGHIESSNGGARDECLNGHLFLSIEDARARIGGGRNDYNQHRFHSALGHLRPSECTARGRQTEGRNGHSLVSNYFRTGPMSFNVILIVPTMAICGTAIACVATKPLWNGAIAAYVQVVMGLTATILTVPRCQ